MSSDRVTITLCARVGALEGADTTSAIAWHREHLGEPGDTSTADDGEVEYFDSRALDTNPKRGDYELRPVNGGWLLRRFVTQTGCYDDIHINEAVGLHQLNSDAVDLATKAGVQLANVCVHFAVWYDGTDEPLADRTTFDAGRIFDRGLEVGLAAGVGGD